MLKKSILFCLVMCLCLGATAQNSEKAEQLLKEVSTKVKSYDNMVITFDYILIDGARHIKQQTKGSVKLQGNKYRLNLMGTTRIFDGKKLYNIIPENEEINISSYNPDNQDLLSPSAMLNFYENGYTYQWDITQNVRGRKVQYVKLIPKDKTSEIKQILLGIDANTKHISKLIQVLDDGTKITIDIRSFKVNQPLSKNTFSFNKDKYQGYYINRLD